MARGKKHTALALAILFRPRLISGSNGYVKTLLGNVNTNPYFIHGSASRADVYLVLALAGYGLDSAQAFIRVQGSRCGDHKLRTVFQTCVPTIGHKSKIQAYINFLFLRCPLLGATGPLGTMMDGMLAADINLSQECTLLQWWRTRHLLHRITGGHLKEFRVRLLGDNFC
jgi:hypothetical protein